MRPPRNDWISTAPREGVEITHGRAGEPVGEAGLECPRITGVALPQRPQRGLPHVVGPSGGLPDTSASGRGASFRSSPLTSKTASQAVPSDLDATSNRLLSPAAYRSIRDSPSGEHLTVTLPCPFLPETIMADVPLGAAPKRRRSSPPLPKHTAETEPLSLWYISNRGFSSLSDRVTIGAPSGLRPIVRRFLPNPS